MPRLWPGLAAIFVVTLFISVGVARDPLFWRNWLAGTTHWLPMTPAPRAIVAGVDDERIPTPRPGHATFSAAALKAATDYAERNKLAALLVVYDDELVLELYGAGNTRQSRLDSGRMQDLLLSLLVGVALNSGQLSTIDVGIDHLLARTGPITIRQLLSGTAGLPSVGNPRNPASIAARLAYSGRASEVSRQGSMHARPGVPDAQPDGLGNPQDANLLVLALRQLFGQPFAVALSEKLWRPMGGMAAQLTLERAGGVARGDGGFYARPLDWAKLGNLLNSSGSVGGVEMAPLAWIKQIVRPADSDPTRGLMVRLARPGEFAADDLYYVDGGAGQRLLVLPSQDLAIVEFGRPQDVDPAELPRLLVQP